MNAGATGYETPKSWIIVVRSEAAAPTGNKRGQPVGRTR